MKIKPCILSILTVTAIGTHAHASDASRTAELTQLYNATRTVCSGISDELQKLKNMTTAGAVVSGVGTVAAGGALYAGLSKEQIDAEIERLEKQICDAGGCDADTVERMSTETFFDEVLQPMGEIAELQEMQQQLEDAEKHSKQLGNWRTGLMAGATATNITSAILSGINRNQSDLIQKIEACNNAIDMVKSANVAGLNPLENPIVQKLDAVKTWCNRLEVAEIEKFEKQQTVAMGTSIAGAATGAAGTVTSAMANDKDVRGDNTESGKKKEKNLNTASNVLAGATTVLGGVSTGFNIASMTKINNIIKRVKRCEEAL